MATTFEKRLQQRYERELANQAGSRTTDGGVARSPEVTEKRVRFEEPPISRPPQGEHAKPRNVAFSQLEASNAVVITDLLAEVRKAIANNQALAVLDAVLSFAAQIYLSTRTYAAIALAIKQFVSNLAHCPAAMRDLLDGAGVFSVFEEFRNMDIDDETAINIFETDYAGYVRTSDGYKKVTRDPAQALSESMGYGVTSLAEGPLGRVYEASEMLFGNVLICAVVGVFGTALTIDHLPFANKVVKAVMGNRRDYVDLFRMVRDLINDAGAYLQYIITADRKCLLRFQDKHSRCMLEFQRVKTAYQERVINYSLLHGDVCALEDMVREATKQAATMKAQNLTAWSHLLEKVTELRTLVDRLPSSMTKPVPYFIMCEGAPGTGKSTFVRRIASSVVCAYHGVTAPSDGSFGTVFEPSDPKFWDGVSAKTKTIIHDDTFSHQKSPAPGDTMFPDMLNMISGSLTFAPMAEAPLKGTVPLLPAFVASCENTYAKLSLWSDNYFALFRRSSAKLVFRYRADMKDGQDVDYDRDVLVDVERYLTPRRETACGEFVVVRKGLTLAQAADWVRQDARRFGAVARAAHARTQDAANWCPTCGVAGCAAKPGDPYSEHKGAAELPTELRGLEEEVHIMTREEDGGVTSVAVSGLNPKDEDPVGAAVRARVPGGTSWYVNVGSVRYGEPAVGATYYDWGGGLFVDREDREDAADRLFTDAPALYDVHKAKFAPQGTWIPAGDFAAQWREFTNRPGRTAWQATKERCGMAFGAWTLFAAIWLPYFILGPMYYAISIGLYTAGLRFNHALPVRAAEAMWGVHAFFTSVTMYVLKTVASERYFPSWVQWRAHQIVLLARVRNSFIMVSRFLASETGRILLAVALAIGAALACYNFVRAETPRSDEFAPLKTTLASGVSSSVMETVSTVCRWYKRESGDQDAHVCAVLVGPNILLTVAHFWHGAERVCPVRRGPTNPGLRTTPRATEMWGDDVYRMKGDLVVVHDRDMHVYDERFVAVHAKLTRRWCKLVLFHSTFQEPQVQDIQVAPMQTLGWVSDGGEYGRDEMCYVARGSVTPGSCGSFLMEYNSVTAKWEIFAILAAVHVADFTSFVPIGADCIAKIEQLRSEWPDGPSVQSIEWLTKSNGLKLTPTIYHPSSALQWAQPDAVVYLGRYTPENSSSGDCTMVRTSFANLATAAGLADEHIQPRSKPRWDEKLGYNVGLSTKWVEGANEGSNKLRHLTPVIMEVMREFEEIVSTSGVSDVAPATLRQALNGFRPAYRGIVRSTSAGGFRDAGPKTQYLLPAECEHYPDGVIPTPQMSAEVVRIVDLWKAGRHYPVHSRLGPKVNEARPMGKDIARTINCVPMAFTVAFRSLFEPLNAAVRNMERLGLLIGKNMGGLDAGDIKRRLDAFSRVWWFDADARAFDLTHQWFAKTVVCLMYLVLAKHVGYSPEAQKALRQAYADACRAYMSYKGDLWIAIATLISGVVGTGEIQSLIAWVLLRVALIMLAMDTPLPKVISAVAIDMNQLKLSARFVFDELLSFHGGDDILGAMKTALRTLYDGRRFAAWLRLVDYVFTSDTDKTKPPDNRPSAEVGVYKRTMREVPGGRVFAPLALKSISKMLHWRDKACAIPTEAQETQILETAQREFFLYGEEEFNAWTDKLQRMARACHLNPKFKTFGELLKDFDAGSLKTWAHAFEDDAPTMGRCACFPWDDALMADCVTPSVGVSGMSPAEGMQSAVGSNITVDDAVPTVCDSCAEVARSPLDGVLPSVDEYLKRPYVFQTTWTSALVTNFQVIDQWFASTPLTQKANYLYGMRCKVCVDITTSNPAAYSGVLACGLAPINPSLTTAGTTATNIVSLDSFGLLDLALCNRVHLEVPFFEWLSFYPMGQTGLGGQESIVLALAEMQPVETTSSAPSLTPTLTVSVYFQDVQVYVPTMSNAVSGRGPRLKTKDVSAFRSGNASDRPKTATSKGGGVGEYASDAIVSTVKATAAFVGVPGMDTALTSEFSKRGVKPSDILRAFGFSMPSALPDVTYMVQRSLPFFATGEAHDYSVNLSLSPTAQQDPAKEQVDGRVGDAMSFENVFRRWGFVGNATIASGTTAGTVVLTLPVHPFTTNLTGRFAPCAVATLTHDMWTGDMEIWLYISSTAFDRGRLAIYWVNNVTQPTYTMSTALSTLNPLIVDLSGSRSIRLTVPWGQQYHWLSSCNVGASAAQAPPNFTGYAGWAPNGCVIVQVLEPITSSASTAPIRQISVMLRAGKNFRVAQPSLNVAQYWSAASGVFNEMEAQIIEHAFIGITLPDEELRNSAGELDVTFRTLLHRRVLTSIWSSQTSFTSGNAQALIVALVDPPVLPSRTTITSGYTFYPTFFGVVAMLFPAWRGSFRHTAHFRNTAGGNAVVGRVIGRRLARDESALVRQSYNGSTYNAASLIYQGTDYGCDMSPMDNLEKLFLSVNVPYCSTSPVQQAMTRSLLQSAAAAHFDAFTGVGSTGMIVEDYVAAGDDMQFYGWTGMPTLTTQTPSTTGWTAL